MAVTSAFPERERVLLPDGRWLAYRTYGAPDGLPVFFCHGSPSSSAEARLFDSRGELRAAGIRLVAADRPGSGGSTFQRGRRIGTWPNDLARLADHLGLQRFGVLGYSGGGPYALVTALRLPERVSTVTTVSGTAPFEVPGVVDRIDPASRRFLQLATTRPLVSRAAAWLMGTVARLAPRRMVEQAAAALPEPDVAAVRRPEIGNAFATMVYETTHGSPQGAQRDTALMTSPWDFDPAQIMLPVRLWHGTEDRNAPPAMAEHLAAVIPDATLTWLRGEGHVSGGANHAATILADLVEREQSRAVTHL